MLLRYVLGQISSVNMILIASALILVAVILR
jgi:hypothetical protein